MSATVQASLPAARLDAVRAAMKEQKVRHIDYVIPCAMYQRRTSSQVIMVCAVRVPSAGCIHRTHR